MDLLSLILAAALGISTATGGTTDEARANIIEIGAQSTAETTTTDDTDEARSSIIDIGANGQ